MAAVMEQKSIPGLREAVLFLCAAVALFTLISLLSFSHEDPAFSHSGTGVVHNRGGMAGAWLADLAFNVFGLIAYALPALLLWMGYLVFRGRLLAVSNTVIILRYLGFIMTLAFGAVLFYLHLLRVDMVLPMGTGGIIGEVMGERLVGKLGNSGANAVSFVGLLAGITLLIDFSWLTLIDTIGGYTLKVFRLLWSTLPETPPAEAFEEPLEPAEETPSTERIAIKIRTQKAPPAHETVAFTEPEITPLTDKIAEFKMGEPKNIRQEPHFEASEPKVSPKPVSIPNEKRMVVPVRLTPKNTETAKAGRQEPQLNQPGSVTMPERRNAATAALHTNSKVKTIVDNEALTARVMGYGTPQESTDEPGLPDYPPRLHSIERENVSYPSFSAQRTVEIVPKTASANKNILPSFSASPAKADNSRSDNSATKIATPKVQSVVLPSLTLLDERKARVKGYTEADLERLSKLVEEVLQDFNVQVNVVDIYPGPVITRFELQPAAGIKVSRISSLAKDLARALSVTSVRIVENIPGKSVIGLEIPNQEREIVTLRELLLAPIFKEAKSPLTLAMGKDIAGTPVVADLSKMPHILVAGTTGSGKSVAIHSMILSLLYKATPEQVRLIMIDPKMLELSAYEGIPHLLTPVVTDMKQAGNALSWAVGEMEHRYKLMSKMGVRNIAGFNQLIIEAAHRGQTIPDPLFQYENPDSDSEECPALMLLPNIVIVIDELADMMMIVGKKVEELIARLAQKARAAGIHLILATQRPSVDVLTGLIKANVPTRIAFQVSSRIDSRTILDQGGAETLLGNGDMLFLQAGTAIPIRAHGAFVEDLEVQRVVDFLKQTAPPNYLASIIANQ